jgi:hypothetical protein
MEGIQIKFLITGVKTFKIGLNGLGGFGFRHGLASFL